MENLESKSPLNTRRRIKIDRLKIKELTLEINSLKIKMEKNLNITRNKIIETPNTQNSWPWWGNSSKFNRNRNTNSRERLENINTWESEQNQNDFELTRPFMRKLKAGMQEPDKHSKCVKVLSKPREWGWEFFFRKS